jgi:hypothetical protein
MKDSDLPILAIALIGFVLLSKYLNNQQSLQAAQLGLQQQQLNFQQKQLSNPWITIPASVNYGAQSIGGLVQTFSNLFSTNPSSGSQTINMPAGDNASSD